MTRNEAVAVIANRLGNRTGLDAKIITELQLAQRELDRLPELPWFKEFREIVAVATSPVALPTSFLRELDDVSLLHIVETDGSRTVVLKDDYNFLRTSEDVDGSGEPTHYALLGTEVYLFPTPDKGYNMDWVYYKDSLALTSDVESVWLLWSPDLLIARAGKKVAQFLRDGAAVQVFDQESKESLLRMLVEDAAHKAAGRELYAGG